MLEILKKYWYLVVMGTAFPIATSFPWPSNDWSIVGSMKFHENIGLSSISQMLTILFLVTLFMERALEVYVLTIRTPGEDKYVGNEEKLAEYKHDTRKEDFSSWSFNTSCPEEFRARSIIFCFNKLYFD